MIESVVTVKWYQLTVNVYNMSNALYLLYTLNTLQIHLKVKYRQKYMSKYIYTLWSSINTYEKVTARCLYIL